MTVPHEPDRIIAAFLDEGITQLADRAYDAVRSDIERTPQQAVIGPWRLPPMITITRVAALAAAVAIAAIAISVSIPNTGPQLGAPAATPISGSGPVALPPDTDLDPATTYRVEDPNLTNVPFTLR